VTLVWQPRVLRHIVRIVRSLLKPLVFLFLATQLLLAIPAGASAPTGPHQTPCEHLSGAPSHDACPCCPDGVSTMKDCLASCTLAATMTSFQVTVPVVRSHDAVISRSSAPATWAADPPLKPPPIA
jgi:hypothetical protein